MKLTEQQKEIALRLMMEMREEEDTGGSDEDFVLEIFSRFLAALPKPEPIYLYDDTQVSIDKDVKLLAAGTLLYTEAPVAPPASEQKPVGHYLGENEDGADCVYLYRDIKKNELLYTAPPKPEADAWLFSEQKPVVLPFALFDQEITDLRRFHECAMDDEGYDVPKDRMKRLAEIGLVRRVSANYYEHTDFGLSVLNGDFDSQPQPDYKAQRDALLKAVAQVKSNLMHHRRFGDDTFQAWKNAAARAEGDLEEALASVKGGV